MRSKGCKDTVSHEDNILGKGMNPTIISLGMGNSRDRLSSLTMATSLREGKLRIQKVKKLLKLSLCRILLVGLGKYIYEKKCNLQFSND